MKNNRLYKKKIETKAIKEAILRDIKNLLKHEKEETNKITNQ